MKRAFLVLVGAVIALLAGTASAGAGGEPTAKVQSIATVVSANNVVFEIDLSGCPAGEPINLLFWESSEPSRPDSAAVTGLTPFGLSNGESVQHLVFQTTSGGFLAGEKWVGDGSVECGTTIISVSGQGQAKSPNGV